MLLRREDCKMAFGEGLDNDTRGWIMTVLSGTGELSILMHFIRAQC